MKVIVVNDKLGLGELGDQINVRDGYARNFLIPRKFVIEATDKNIKSWNIIKKQKSKKLQKIKEEMQKLAEKLNNQEIKVTIEAGSMGKLYGSISNHNVASYIKECFEVDIDRHRIVLPQKHIKEAGQYMFQVKLYPEVTAEMKLIIEGKVKEEAEDEKEGRKVKKGTRGRKKTTTRSRKEDSQIKEEKEKAVNEEEK